jgi:hypothetical protein
MKTNVDSNAPLISNGFVTCYSDYFVIHWYYFPFGTKKVKYSDIRSCDFESTDNMDLLSFKHWGMALSPIWWHCDMKRLSRKYFILIDANQWPKIGLTMDDNDIINVFNLIRQKIFVNQSNNSIEKELEHQKSLQQSS